MGSADRVLADYAVMLLVLLNFACALWRPGLRLRRGAYGWRPSFLPFIKVSHDLLSNLTDGKSYT
jgi:hypothetical protein